MTELAAGSPTNGPEDLPEFTSPPLVEVAFAVQFQELHQFSQVDMGLFWNSIRETFPNYKDRPRLDPMPDPIQPKAHRPFELNIVRASPVDRVWFISSDEQRLVQLQPDRLAMNWRNQENGGDPYPRFDNLVEEFADLWGKFTDFCAARELDSPQASVTELLYVNRIEARSLSDILRPVERFELSLQETPGPLETSVRIVSPIVSAEERLGLLRIVAEPIVLQEQVSTFKMDLAARVSPASSDWTSLRSSFELGRRAIVANFDELTESDLHKAWGRRNRK